MDESPTHTEFILIYNEVFKENLRRNAERVLDYIKDIYPERVDQAVEVFVKNERNIRSGIEEDDDVEYDIVVLASSVMELHFLPPCRLFQNVPFHEHTTTGQLVEAFNNNIKDVSLEKRTKTIIEAYKNTNVFLDRKAYQHKWSRANPF